MKRVKLRQGLERSIVRAVVSLSLVAVACVTAIPAPAQTVVASKTRPRVETLASSKFEGREVGSRGEQLAGDYIASEIVKIGAKPLPGRREVFVPFEFSAATEDGGSRISIERDNPAGVIGGVVSGVDNAGRFNGVRALSFSDNASVTGPVVFAGYGIVVPESQNFGYDSYATLDVKDKIVVVLRYFPEDADPQTKATLARYSDLRFKAMQARQHGAKAMLVVTGPRSPNAGELVPMSFDTAVAGSGIAAASVNGRVAEQIFAGGPSLDETQKNLDTGNPHVAGFDIPNVTVALKTEIVRKTQQGRNVIAYIPATGVPAGVAKPWIAIGAHYDHLGFGGHGNSLAGKDEAGKPHLGADDNASGTAAVLAIAEAIAKDPSRKRNVLVALWSGEEIGLVGSNAFVNSPPIPLDQIAAYLNFDMVGRMQDNKLSAQATGTSPVWASILERANVAAGFDLTLAPDPYQPTDVASFNTASVPCLTFTTGAHADYHKPSDTADKIDYADLDRIADFATVVVRRLMETPDAPQFTKVEQSSQTAGRIGVRVFTGTVPDYTTEAKGLLLGGVIGGGPAEQAGLQKGDVIVEIAGQTIANVYDYTYALELLKIGQPVKVVYTRNGERKETTLTPGARK
jgi:hypothetical protein